MFLKYFPLFTVAFFKALGYVSSLRHVEKLMIKHIHRDICAGTQKLAKCVDMGACLLYSENRGQFEFMYRSA